MLHPKTTAHIIPAPGKRGARVRRSVSIGRSGATALALGAVLSLVGCSANPRIDDRHPIDTTHRSLTQESRVRYLILHFTWEGFEDSLKVLTRGAVSSHYLIDESPPRIYRLVEEDRWQFPFWESASDLDPRGLKTDRPKRKGKSDDGPSEIAEPWTVDRVLGLIPGGRELRRADIFQLAKVAGIESKRLFDSLWPGISDRLASRSAGSATVYIKGTL
jgi:hypothetical protein